jgi:tetrahydromethanopterin S-methyltransferase subunit G
MSTEKTPKPTKADLQEEIEATREDLADTIDELTSRLDVKSHVHDRVEDAKNRVEDAGHAIADRATDSHGRPIPAGVVVGAALAVVVAVVLWRRRSH